MKTITSVDAQNRFGELLDTARREPVSITRRGRPVAFMVSPEDMKELVALRSKRKRVLADFEAFFAATDKILPDDVNNLTDSDINRLVHELR